MVSKRKRGGAKKGVHVRVVRDNELPKVGTGVNADINVWPPRMKDGEPVRATVDLETFNLVMGTDFKTLAEVEKFVNEAKTYRMDLRRPHEFRSAADQRPHPGYMEMGGKPFVVTPTLERPELLLHPMPMLKRDPAKAYRDALTDLILTAMQTGVLKFGFTVETVEEDAATLTEFLKERNVEAKTSEIFQIMRDIMNLRMVAPSILEMPVSKGIFRPSAEDMKPQFGPEQVDRAAHRLTRGGERAKPVPFPHIVLEKTGPDLSGASSEKLRTHGIPEPTQEQRSTASLAALFMRDRVLPPDNPLVQAQLRKDFDGDELNLSMTQVEIGGYKTQTKGDPTGAPRQSPIRAFGESEMRHPSYSPTMPWDKPRPTLWQKIKRFVRNVWRSLKPWQ